MASRSVAASIPPAALGVVPLTLHAPSQNGNDQVIRVDDAGRILGSDGSTQGTFEPSRLVAQGMTVFEVGADGKVVPQKTLAAGRSPSFDKGDDLVLAGPAGELLRISVRDDGTILVGQLGQEPAPYPPHFDAVPPRGRRVATLLAGLFVTIGVFTEPRIHVGSPVVVTGQLVWGSSSRGKKRALHIRLGKPLTYLVPPDRVDRKADDLELDPASGERMASDVGRTVDVYGRLLQPAAPGGTGESAPILDFAAIVPAGFPPPADAIRVE